jgi:preprotein translocase subunit SecA
VEDWDLKKLWTSLKQLYPIGVTIEDLEDEAGGPDALDTEFLTAQLQDDAQAAYARREEELGSENMRELERQVLLQVIDRKWREHLYEMDYLQEGVGLRAYAQRDPLVEYQREGFDMFSQMLEGIKEEAVGFLFNAEVHFEDSAPAPAQPAGVPLPDSAALGGQPHIQAKGLGMSRLPQALQYSAPTIDGAAGAGGVVVEQAPALGIGSDNGGGSTGSGNGRAGGGRRGGSGRSGTAQSGGTRAGTRGEPNLPTAAGARKPSPGQAVGSGPSRNAPCYCGSGKKYKRCHGAPGAA